MYSTPIEFLDEDATDEERDRAWFWALIYPEGDGRRGICLVTVSAMESTLSTILEHERAGNKEYRNKTQHKEPLKRLKLEQKIDNALALGILIEYEAQRCHIIREIRNLMAHSVEANFMIEPLKSLALRLFDTRLHGPKPDEFFIFFVAIQEILLKLRRKTREIGAIVD